MRGAGLEMRGVGGRNGLCFVSGVWTGFLLREVRVKGFVRRTEGGLQCSRSGSSAVWAGKIWALDGMQYAAGGLKAQKEHSPGHRPG